MNTPDRVIQHHQHYQEMKKMAEELHPMGVTFSQREHADLVDLCSWADDESKRSRFWESVMFAMMHPELRYFAFSTDAYVRVLDVSDSPESLKNIDADHDEVYQAIGEPEYIPPSQDPKAQEGLITTWFEFEDGELVRSGAYTTPYIYEDDGTLVFTENEFDFSDDEKSRTKTWMYDYVRRSMQSPELKDLMHTTGGEFKEAFSIIVKKLTDKGHVMSAAREFVEEYLQ